MLPGGPSLYFFSFRRWGLNTNVLLFIHSVTVVQMYDFVVS